MRRSRSKPDRGVVSFQTRLINQEDEVVMSMKATSINTNTRVTTCHSIISRHSHFFYTIFYSIFIIEGFSDI